MSEVYYIIDNEGCIFFEGTQEECKHELQNSKDEIFLYLKSISTLYVVSHSKYLESYYGGKTICEF